MTVSNLTILFDDAEHRTAYLRQLSILLCLAVALMYFIFLRQAVGGLAQW